MHCDTLAYVRRFQISALDPFWPITYLSIFPRSQHALDPTLPNFTRRTIVRRLDLLPICAFQSSSTSIAWRCYNGLMIILIAMRIEEQTNKAASEENLPLPNRPGACLNFVLRGVGDTQGCASRERRITSIHCFVIYAARMQCLGLGRDACLACFHLSIFHRTIV